MNKITLATYYEQIDCLFVAVETTIGDEPAFAEVAMDFQDDTVTANLKPRYPHTRIQLIAAVLSELQAQTTNEDEIPFVDAAKRLAEARHEFAI